MSPALTVVPPTGADGRSPPGDRSARRGADLDERPRQPAGNSPAGRQWVCVRGADGHLRTSPVRGIWLDGALVFRAEHEFLAAAELADVPAAVVQLEDEERLTLAEGTASRVYDPTVLARFASEFEAKYGCEPHSRDPGGLVYALRMK
jgi:hypothetical protein